MTLLKCFSLVDEQGRIPIGRNFMIQMGLKSHERISLKVVRITGSGREPYLIVSRLGDTPRFTRLQTVVFDSCTRLDEHGNIQLDDPVMAISGFEPGLSVEFKLTGPANGPWLAIRNKGPAKLTTLQEKMGLRQKKKWNTMPLEY